VDESTAVQLYNNHVLSASYVGIRLSRASADILGNDVRGARSPFGMGIELANTINKPPSMIHQNVIADNPYEGFVMHNSNAMVENNTVTGNGFQGIAVTEMSMAMVRANTVRDNAEVGIYIVDNSMAEIVGNHVSAMKPGPTGNADGIRAYYYAEVTLSNNTIEGPPDHAVTSGYEAIISQQ
jgi:parallel beta-helix repeat protein